jgi:hypothetical protein
MSTEPVRAGRGWLALREPADAAARSAELIEALRDRLPAAGAVVHDLGCGTGSMARWLAPRLDGPCRWVLHDRDAELLHHAAAHPPGTSPGTSPGARPGVELRRDDITRLDPQDLAGASLLTASAVLDMFTGAELDRFVATCAGAGCPVLLTLSVVGLVEIDPGDPLDLEVQEAFNDHQRRRLADAPLLGPDAAPAAVDGFRRRGLSVEVRPSPWRLGPDQADLALAWFAGWVGAAREQVPELAGPLEKYTARRRAELASGTATVMVHHVDLLALP